MQTKFYYNIETHSTDITSQHYYELAWVSQTSKVGSHKAYLSCLVPLLSFLFICFLETRSQSPSYKSMRTWKQKEKERGKIKINGEIFLWFLRMGIKE